MTLTAVSEKLIKALPPGLIVLIVLNCVFIGVEAYRTGERNILLTKIVDRCLAQHP